MDDTTVTVQQKPWSISKKLIWLMIAALIGLKVF